MQYRIEREREWVGGSGCGGARRERKREKAARQGCARKGWWLCYTPVGAEGRECRREKREREREREDAALFGECAQGERARKKDEAAAAAAGGGGEG